MRKTVIKKTWNYANIQRTLKCDHKYSYGHSPGQIVHSKCRAVSSDQENAQWYPLVCIVRTAMVETSIHLPIHLCVSLCCPPCPQDVQMNRGEGLWSARAYESPCHSVLNSNLDNSPWGSFVVCVFCGIASVCVCVCVCVCITYIQECFNFGVCVSQLAETSI